jgi:pimeloyl-ACP methyl ester carboxylesterase
MNTDNHVAYMRSLHVAIKSNLHNFLRHLFRQFAIISALFIFTACMPRSAEKFESTIPVKNRPDNRQCSPTKPVAGFRLSEHVLVSSSQGDIPIGDKLFEPPRHNGDFSTAFKSIMAGYIRANTGRSDHPMPFLFYFNGGLNSQRDVEGQAEKQIPCIMADGYYPVFFAWDTEFFRSYAEQVTYIWDGFYRDDFWRYPLIPFRVISGFASAIGHAPVDYATEAERVWYSLSRTPECEMRINDTPAHCLSNYYDGYNESKPYQSVVQVGPTADEYNWNPWPQVSYAALFPARLVLTPFSNTLGDTAWKNFVRCSRTTIRQSNEFNFLNNPDIYHDNGYPRGTGVFSKFFETLLQYRMKVDGKLIGKRLCPKKSFQDAPLLCEQRELPEHYLKDQNKIAQILSKSKITLIGHSMGGIVINELVERYPDLEYKDIVVMASAASVRETRRVMDRYFEGEKKASMNTRFYSLMLHPLAELRERQGLGAVPSGSLLVWINQFYEVPKTPEDRTFGYWPSARVARRMFGGATQERMLYRIFNLNESQKGDPANPIQHSDFNDDEVCFWRPAFWGVKKTGYLANRYKYNPITEEPGLPTSALDECLQY